MLSLHGAGTAALPGGRGFPRANPLEKPRLNVQIDKSAFFLAMSSLAAGGAGGYLVADRNASLPVRSPEPSVPAPSQASTAPDAATPAAPPVPPVAAAPTCDDGIGAPAACPPPPYSADESGCAPVASVRCAEFKQTMKPRVAESAVACLNALSGAQRCDPARVNLCGHMALMQACEPPAVGEASTDDLAARCRSMLQSCPGAAMRECESILAGMTSLGRERIAQCLASHCADKGLVGCEGAGAGK